MPKACSSMVGKSSSKWEAEVRYLTCNQNNMTNRGGTERAKNEFKIKAHFRKVYSLWTNDIKIIIWLKINDREERKWEAEHKKNPTPSFPTPFSRKIPVIIFIWSQLRKCNILGLFWFGFPLSLKQMSDKVRISLK